VYDREEDEFEAHVPNNVTDPCIVQPISVGCLITGRCNLECGFCYGNKESLPQTEISAGDWASIFRHLRTWGVMRVDLSGGEPTIRKDLPGIARTAIEVGLNVVISTNGLLLGDEALDSFPTVHWHVSMDSGLPHIHESSRVLHTLNPSFGSFQKTTKFVIGCLDRRQRVRVLTSLGAHNTDQLFALGEHLALIGVPEWNLSRILRAGRAQSEYEERWAINDEEVLEQLHDLRSAFPFIRIRYSNRTE
jgi:MoaA/NifB/PqqE/SkfB family radical SAM enzyme